LAPVNVAKPAICFFVLVEDIRIAAMARICRIVGAIRRGCAARGLICQSRRASTAQRLGAIDFHKYGRHGHEAKSHQRADEGAAGEIQNNFRRRRVAHWMKIS
jgi:hypothetical protein